MILIMFCINKSSFSFFCNDISKTVTMRIFRQRYINLKGFYKLYRKFYKNQFIFTVLPFKGGLNCSVKTPKTIPSKQIRVLS